MGKQEREFQIEVEAIMGAMQGLVLVILFFILCFNYAKHRDLLYPPVLQAGLWLIILLLYIMNEDFFIPISDHMFFIVLNGVFMFSIGSIFAINGKWKHKHDRGQKKEALSKFKMPDRSIFYSVLFWTSLLGLPFYLYKTYTLGTGGSYSFFMNVRYALTSDDGNLQSYGVLSYLVTISNFSLGIQMLLYLKNKRKKILFISILIALLYALFSTGRTFFMMLFLMIVGFLLITRKLSFAKGFFLFIFSGIFVFVVIGLLLAKGGSIDNSIADNMQSMWDNFRIYLLGALPAFDLYSQQFNVEPTYGLNIFRTIFVILSKIGYHVNPPLLIKQYELIPMPINVYTLYQPYFNDFSFWGVYLIQLLLGFLHGVVYKKAIEGREEFVFMYAITLYPLFMQFFQDQYFSLLSDWLQYGMLLIVFSFVIRHAQQRPVGKASIPHLNSGTHSRGGER